MKILIAPRQAGKTLALVEHIKGGEKRASGWTRVLLCSSEREAARLRHDYDLDAGQCMSTRDWSTYRQGHLPPESVAVDNIEDWFYSQFGLVPDLVTSSAAVEVQNLEHSGDPAAGGPSRHNPAFFPGDQS